MICCRSRAKSFLSAFGAPDMVPDSIRHVMSARLQHSAPWLLTDDVPPGRQSARPDGQGVPIDRAVKATG